MIIGIKGPLGSGKTSVLTFVALRQYAMGLNVFPNYKLKFPAGKGTVIPFNPDDFLNGNWQGPGILTLDEMQAWLESRISSSHFNRLSTQMVIQTRKKSTHLAFTTPYFGLVDPRIRKLMDVAIECQRKGDYVKLRITKLNDGRTLQKKLYLPPLYGLFDTMEIVQVIDNIKNKKLEPAKKKDNVSVPL